MNDQGPVRRSPLVDGEVASEQQEIRKIRQQLERKRPLAEHLAISRVERALSEIVKDVHAEIAIQKEKREKREKRGRREELADVFDDMKRLGRWRQELSRRSVRKAIELTCNARGLGEETPVEFDSEDILDEVDKALKRGDVNKVLEHSTAIVENFIKIAGPLSLIGAEVIEKMGLRGNRGPAGAFGNFVLEPKPLLAVYGIELLMKVHSLGTDQRPGEKNKALLTLLGSLWKIAAKDTLLEKDDDEDFTYAIRVARQQEGTDREDRVFAHLDARVRASCLIERMTGP